jgi:hypothetical protein
MWKAVVVATLPLLPVQAAAHPRHHHYRAVYISQAMASLVSDDRVLKGRPSGCPHAFCGCEASLFRFGRIIPHLNLAANWRRFPRAVPSPGMAAVRSGHVMILQQHLEGNVWYVHDGNSGGHVTREHAVSIAGYTIVDPSSGSTFGAMSAGQGASSYAAAPPVARHFMRRPVARRFARASL